MSSCCLLMSLTQPCWYVKILARIFIFFCRRLFDVFLFNICSYRHRWHINTWSLAFVLTFLISNFTSICYSFTMSNSLNSNEKFDHAVHESVGSSDDEVLEKYLLAQQALEQENGIKYRTCSWQKTAALVFSEYICLAILSFPWSYSVLGLIPGLILTFVTALSTLYTGITIWEFCLKNPNVRTVCDIGQHLFWGKKWAWWFTAACFLLNNTFIQALHVLVGSKYLTLSPIMRYVRLSLELLLPLFALSFPSQERFLVSRTWPVFLLPPCLLPLFCAWHLLAPKNTRLALMVPQCTGT